MSDDELIILAFLQTNPESFFARREIARKAVRREVFEQNPQWVSAPLAALLGKGVIEQNDSGLYRIKKELLR